MFLRKSHIDIKAAMSGDFLVLEIVDDGVGLSKGKENLHESKGLKLVEERLKIRHRENQITLKNREPRGVEAKIKLKIS